MYPSIIYCFPLCLLATVSTYPAIAPVSIYQTLSPAYPTIAIVSLYPSIAPVSIYFSVATVSAYLWPLFPSTVHLLQYSSLSITCYLVLFPSFFNSYCFYLSCYGFCHLPNELLLSSEFLCLFKLFIARYRSTLIIHAFLVLELCKNCPPPFSETKDNYSRESE